MPGYQQQRNYHRGWWLYPIGAMYSRLAAAAFPSRSKVYNDATERKLVVAEAVWGGGMCAAGIFIIFNLYLLHSGTWEGMLWWIKWSLSLSLPAFLPFFWFAARRFKRDISNPDHQEQLMLEQVTDTFMDLIVGYQQEVVPQPAIEEKSDATAHMDLGCTIEDFYTKTLAMLEGYYLNGISWSQKEWVTSRAVFTRKQWELAIPALRSRNIIEGPGHGKIVLDNLDDAVRLFWMTPTTKYVMTQQGLLGV